MLKKWLIVCAVLCAVGTAAAEDQGDNAANIDIRSTAVGTRVYLEDTYVGDADLFLEDVPPGEHMIIMRQGSKRVAGPFKVRAGETLMIEGRFDEDRIVDLKKVAREDAAKRAEKARRQEAELKQKERQTKTAGTKKKAEQKKIAAARTKLARNRRDERVENYLTLVRVDFQERKGTEVHIASRSNAASVTNFTDNSSFSGKLYRSKQNYTLCEGSGCSRDWNGRFFYSDDAGKRDAFLIRWRETIFSGITLEGTSKEEIDLCLNGDCKRIKYAPNRSGVMQVAMDRYVLIWEKDNFTLRRADLLKEIITAGGRVPAF